MRFDRLQQMGCALSASLALNVALLTLVGTARLVRTSEGCATKSETSNPSNLPNANLIYQIPSNLPNVRTYRYTTEVTARAHVARACLGLVLQSCAWVPLGCMQGGSHWPGPAVEPERARWHDLVLGRWLGLTPERPALCLRGYPRRPRVALSRVSDPPGLGRL